jgi:hypothetical protein
MIDPAAVLSGPHTFSRGITADPSRGQALSPVAVQPVIGSILPVMAATLISRALHDPDCMAA